MSGSTRNGDTVPGGQDEEPDDVETDDSSPSSGSASGVVTIPRAAFLTRYFQYEPGNHLTLLGPTQSGKSTLAFQLLKVSTYEKLPGVVLVMKPRDPVVSDMAVKLDYQVIRDWPPPIRHRRQVKTRGKIEIVYPKGWMVWPKHTFDTDRDDAHMHAVFKRTLMGSYQRGNTVLFADEVFGLAKELHLERELAAIWSRGAAMGCGLWASSQRPYSIPQWAYSSPEHIFLANDPDKRDRDRYKEIGGVDPDLVEYITRTLPKYHWLYIRRTGPEMCIVGA